MSMWGNFDAGGFMDDGFNQQNQGGGGGGFMPGGGGAGSATSPQQGAKRGAAGKAMQTVIPCNVAQLMEAQSDTTGKDCFVLNGVELGQVSVVAMVRKMQEMNTSITYEVDDHTAAPILVRVWVDADGNVANADEVRQITEGTYVRVYGQLRLFMSQKSIVAFRIQPLHDMNEITSHMLEVVYSHMYLDKKQQGALNNTAANMPMNTTAMQGGGGQYGGVNTTSGYGAATEGGLSGVQKQVHDFISSSTEPSGISIQSVENQFRNVARDQIRKAIEFLNDEGHIYSTIDEEHYKSTDSM